MTQAVQAPLFRETQQYRQPWLWALVLIVAAVTVLAAVLALSTRPTAGAWVSLAAVFVLDALLLALFHAAKLDVAVEPDALRVRFVPFLRKRIPLADILYCEPRTYHPILEYGGWGVRWWPGHGWAYNVSGNRGVQLLLTSGRKLLLGSQRPEALAAAIHHAKGD